MRRKIQDIIQGKFEYDCPALMIEEDELRFTVVEKEDYSGSFHIKSSSDQAIRGIVTCENPYIKVITTEFDGISAEIKFTFSGSQVLEGETQNGCFVITSSSGEYLLDFQAGITRHYLPSSIGKIKTLTDFSNLSSLSWEEALSIFASPHFCNIFHEDAAFYSLLYHGLTEKRCSSHEMEEFLIATGKKTRIRFEADVHQKEYQLQNKMTEDTFDVKKSQWGYCDIQISCDAAFINLKKKRLQMHDFCGKHAKVSYQIIPRLMHRGKNYGVITLENCFQKVQIPVTAFLGEKKQEHTSAWEKRKIYASLIGSYLSWQLQEKTTQEWKNEMLGILQSASEADPGNRWFALYEAYVYLQSKEPEAASKCMLTIHRNSRNARTPLAAFYMYLTTLLDEEYDSSQVYSRIREIQLKYRRHPVLNWIMLQLDDTLNRNPQRKYQTIKKYMTENSISPVFYLEAAAILQENPEILNSQDSFDFRLISWMAKKNLLTRELSLRIQSMAQGKNTFHKSYLRVLSKCYKKYAEDSLIKTICVYLIHTSCYGETYFPWYKRGIENHLKIAGLYEAYMLSWSRSMGELPPEVVRYFSMNSSLPSKKKAMLFAYIARNKQRLKKDWSSYMVMVKNFAIKELEMGHINDDLAIIYEELRRMMSKEEWDAVKNEVESCYKIHTRGESVSFVRVLQKVPDTMRQRSVISEDCAYLYLYRKPYVILYEDCFGNLYTTKDSCRMSKMLTGNSIYAPVNEQPVKKNEELILQEKNFDIRRLEQMAGSINEMQKLLLDADKKGISVLPYAQQLMIRMLFTEHLGKNHGIVFDFIRGDQESEKLILAYVTILCKDYITKEKTISEDIYKYLGNNIKFHKKINPYCKVSFLQFHYSTGQTEYEEQAENLLKNYLFDGVYFSFYDQLPLELKRKYLLMDLKVVTWIGVPQKTYYLEFSKGRKDSMREVLPGVYSCPVRMLPKDSDTYRIMSNYGTFETCGTIGHPQSGENVTDTRYGMLAALNGSPDTKTQYEYAQMCDLVNALFMPVKE